MDIPNLRWWGWGTLDQGYSLENRPAFWPTLIKWLELPDGAPEHETPPVPLDEIALRPSRLDDPVYCSLRKLLGNGTVHTDRQARIEHAYGKSYRDLVRIRAGYVPNPPDAVIYPADQGQIAALLAWAADRDVVIIPFGGGSSVLGGVEPQPGEQTVLTLDLARLDRVLALDPVSRTARIQAGATGPEIEAQLNARGFTLGHFPQSFEFSTLGGWIATRATGQNAIGYGSIGYLTQAVRAVTPMGIIEANDVPATAAGPSLLQVLVGSEGAYGVIVEATMRIHPLPAVRDYRGLLFHSLEDGLAAYRDLMQTPGISPTIVRLSDARETAACVALNHELQGLRRLADLLTRQLLRVQKYDLFEGSVLMILGFEGSARWTKKQWELALDICGAHRGSSLGQAVGKTWMRERFALPYLRDILLGAGILVDTLETATTWSHLPKVYAGLVNAIKTTILATGGGPGYVMTHISHANAHGASLCTTFMGRQVPDPDPLAKQAQWEEIKRAATDAILAANGTLTHQHGVGREHAPWLQEEIGPVGIQMLRALKQTLDPGGIMNPGVLLPE